MTGRGDDGLNRCRTIDRSRAAHLVLELLHDGADERGYHGNQRGSARRACRYHKTDCAKKGPQVVGLHLNFGEPVSTFFGAFQHGLGLHFEHREVGPFDSEQLQGWRNDLTVCPRRANEPERPVRQPSAAVQAASGSR